MAAATKSDQRRLTIMFAVLGVLVLVFLIRTFAMGGGDGGSSGEGAPTVTTTALDVGDPFDDTTLTAPGSTAPGSTDSGSTDSGSTDSGSTDSGSTDSGSTDSGAPPIGGDTGDSPDGLSIRNPFEPAAGGSSSITDDDE